MKLLSLSVKKRDPKAASPRALRREGQVPAVLYGQGAEAVSVTIGARELDIALHSSAGEHALVELKFDDDATLNCPALVKEVQHHPVRGHVIHADMFRIDLSKKISTIVPINLIGQSKGVVEGGVLDFQCREVEIECLALDVPEQLDLDVATLDIGHSLHVSDLKAPENVEILTPGDRAVVAVHAPRVVKAAQTAEETAAEAAEAEEDTEGSGA